MAAAKEAAMQINVGELEANIAASLQSQLEAGHTKQELMQQFAAGDDFSLPATT